MHKFNRDSARLTCNRQSPWPLAACVAVLCTAPRRTHRLNDPPPIPIAKIASEIDGHKTQCRK